MSGEAGACDPLEVSPQTRGVTKLLARETTLRDWVAQGRDNYELARAFHVPIGDVRTVVAVLGLVRPYEAEFQLAPDPLVERRCSACRAWIKTTRYRFRCDPCLDLQAGWWETDYSVAVGW